MTQVSTVLASMVTALHDTQSSRLLKHVVRCYLRLSENVRAREVSLQDNAFVLHVFPSPVDGCSPRIRSVSSK